jgi:hypothetical protein
MTYCSPSDVRLVVNTGLSDAEVASLIGMSDAQIDKKLGAQSPSDTLIRKLSVLLTAGTIRARDPSSFAVGEYSESAVDTPSAWDAEIREIEGMYRRSLRRV